MIQGGSGVVSCDWTSLPCENPEYFLNLCLVLKQYITLEQYSDIMIKVCEIFAAKIII